MKTFWLSWWDDPNGTPGKHLPEQQRQRLKTWVTGYRERDEQEQQSICARVEAESTDDAWALVEVMYPGARGDVRFENECAAAWWPPADRFPRNGGGR